MSFAGAYRMRGRADGAAFRFGWKAAVEMAYYAVRDIALARIERGIEIDSTYHGKVIATQTVFSDRLLLGMLEHLKPAAGETERSGLRRAAGNPGHAFALAVEAYGTAIESGKAPVAPEYDEDCALRSTPIMTREEFIQKIEAARYSSPEEREQEAENRMREQEILWGPPPWP